MNPDNTVLKFRTPVHLLKILVPELQLYPWQIDTLFRASGYIDGTLSGRYEEPTPERPFKLCLPAANGSGKDMVVIAAFAVWNAMRFAKTQIVITTASWDQLKKQTEPHIAYLVKKVNSCLGKFFHSVQFNHVCTETGSQIILRVTDEPGRIEGWHPWTGGKLVIIINEAKSIDEAIFNALDSCTGFSWWMEVSSPGPKAGRFFRSSLDAVQWPAPVELGQYFYRKVTAFDCPHIPRSHIEYMRKHKPKWWFQYSIMAEFFSQDEEFVITEDMWITCVGAKPALIGDDFGVGLDLGAGGDATVMYLRRGNKVIDRFSTVESDTVTQAGMIAAWLDQRGVPKRTSPTQVVYFRADGGGVGHGTLDNLERLGWKFQRCHNQAAAFEKDLYVNFGAEVWFHTRTLLQQNAIIPTCETIDDTALKRQLFSRKYDAITTGRARLEDKKAHKAREQESPDDGDAFNLCFSTLHAGSLIAQIDRTKAKPTRMSIEELEGFFSFNNLQRFDHGNSRTTLLTGSI